MTTMCLSVGTTSGESSVVPTASEALVIATTAIGPTTATAVGARAMLVTWEAQPARFTIDGSAPTTAVGHLVGAGDSVYIRGGSAVKNFLTIRTGGTSSACTITYFT